MINVEEVLKTYKRLEITKSQLNEALGDNFQLAADSEPVIVDNQDLIFVLQAVKKGNLSVPALVDWVNIIWFSELYDYADKHSDSMASVMTELEELDENEYDLPIEQINAYIAALEKNTEYSAL